VHVILYVKNAYEVCNTQIVRKSGTMGNTGMSTQLMQNVFNISTIHADPKVQTFLSVKDNVANYLLFTLIRCQYSEYITSNFRLIDGWWFGKDLEVSSCDLPYVFSWNLHGGTEKTTKKSSVRKASVPVEIRTEHFLNTSSERYRYTILLCLCLWCDHTHAVTIRSWKCNYLWIESYGTFCIFAQRT
jgi:hypothetical protein